MSLHRLVEVVLVGGPLDGERRMVGETHRLRTFTVAVEDPTGRPAKGPLGFPLVIGHDYALGEDGVWRYVKPEPPEPLPDLGIGWAA